MDLLVLLLASLSGCCGSLAACAISYPAHRAKGAALPPWENFLSLLANLALTGLQVGFGFAATRFGPVAVVMPLSVGAALFSNMILQQALKLAKFTNTSITGTLVLVTAIMMLPELGPAQPEEEADPLELLQAPKAILFISASLVTCGGSLAALLLNLVEGNMVKLILFALVGGNGTVLNMSIQKMLMCDPPAALATLLFAAYISLSVLCLASGALANGTLSDPSLFVPLNNAINLFLNCLAGLFIWRDYQHLEYPWSYFMVYTLVGLGSYLVSSIDVFSLVRLAVHHHLAHAMQAQVKHGFHSATRRAQTTFLRAQTAPNFNESAAVGLLTARKPSATDFTASSVDHFHAGLHLLDITDRKEFEKRLLTEMDKRMVSNEDVVRLVANLLEGTGGIEDNNFLEDWVSSVTQEGA